MNFRALILYYFFFLAKFIYIEIIYCLLCSPTSLCYLGKILEKILAPPPLDQILDPLLIMQMFLMSQPINMVNFQLIHWMRQNRTTEIIQVLINGLTPKISLHSNKLTTCTWLFTPHGKGTRTGTRNWTSTIAINGSCFLSLPQTSVSISVQYIRTHCFQFPFPVPVLLQTRAVLISHDTYYFISGSFTCCTETVTGFSLLQPESFIFTCQSCSAIYPTNLLIRNRSAGEISCQ